MQARLKRRGIVMLGVVVLSSAVFVVAIWPGIACAHHPHDPIDAIGISPTFSTDQTLFIAWRDTLLRSTDGGSSWKHLWNGLDHTGPFTSIQVSPMFGSDGTVFASTEGDGVFRSVDAGWSWTRVNQGITNLDIQSLAVSPRYDTDGTILAVSGSGELYLTDRGGDMWKEVSTDEVNVTSVGFVADRVWVGDGDGTLRELSAQSELTEFATLGAAGAITVIADAPGAGSATVFVGTSRGGLFRSDDAGSSFDPSNQGLSDEAQRDPRSDWISIQSVAFSPGFQSDRMVFASGRDEAPFRSADGGLTWQKTAVGVTCNNQAYQDPKYSDRPQYRDLSISNDFSEDQTLFLGAWDGLFKSTDRGRTWIELETTPVSLVKGLDVSTGNDDAAVVGLTTYGGGAYMAADRASSWSVANQGLVTTRLGEIAFSPIYESDRTVFSGSAGRLLKSTDGALTWQSIELRYDTLKKSLSSFFAKLGLPHGWMLSQLEKDVPYPNTIAFSPNFADDRTLFFTTRRHGVYRSVDAGRTYESLGLAGDRISDLVVSPSFSTEPTLFVTIRERGVFRSRDGGDTWESANNGLTFLDDWNSRPTFADTREKKALLAISPAFTSDRTVFVASSGGLFRSLDEGDSWDLLGTDEFGERYFALAIGLSPSYGSDGSLLISVRGVGLFKSEDRGETFIEIGRQLIENNQSIEFLDFAAAYPLDGTIYAASKEALFVSTDRGETWEIRERPVRYENNRDVIAYTGEWSVDPNEEASATSTTSLLGVGSRAILRFVGSGVTWIGERSPEYGLARVFIDGQLVEEIDLYDDVRQARVPLVVIDDLPFGPHVIEIEAVGKAGRGAASAIRVGIDAFDVFP